MDFYFDPAKDKVPRRETFDFNRNFDSNKNFDTNRSFDINRNKEMPRVTANEADKLVRIHSIYSCIKDYSEYYMNNNAPNFPLASLVTTLTHTIYDHDILSALKQNKKQIIDQIRDVKTGSNPSISVIILIDELLNILNQF